MITYKKIEKLFTDFSETAKIANEEDFRVLKDEQIGKLFIAGENIINAVEKFINMIDSELLERDEIFLPETEQKIVKEYEPILKIEKASKASSKKTCDCKSGLCSPSETKKKPAAKTTTKKKK